MFKCLRMFKDFGHNKQSYKTVNVVKLSGKECDAEICSQSIFWQRSGIMWHRQTAGGLCPEYREFQCWPRWWNPFWRGLLHSFLFQQLNHAEPLNLSVLPKRESLCQVGMIGNVKRTACDKDIYKDNIFFQSEDLDVERNHFINVDKDN